LALVPTRCLEIKRLRLSNYPKAVTATAYFIHSFLSVPPLVAFDQNNQPLEEVFIPHGPLCRENLGWCSWAYFHTMLSRYPVVPREISLDHVTFGCCEVDYVIEVEYSSNYKLDVTFNKRLLRYQPYAI
jgi:hypothetical protein